MFLEILKAILMGVVEGITEWLPISSTGHMILVEQIIQFNASEEFLSMFRVVIQLGAILAVVVLFWHKLWPFGLQHGRVVSKPQVWQLWFKVVAATPARAGHQPAGRLDGGPLLQLHHRGRHADLVRRALYSGGKPPHHAPCHPSGADHLPGSLSRGRVADAGHHPRHLPLRCHHRGRPAAGPLPCLRGRVHVLPRHPGHGRCLPCSRWSNSSSPALP